MPEKKKSFGQTLCNSKELSRSMENVEVMGVEERDENFEIVEEFLAEENLDSVVGDEFTEVLGKYKCWTNYKVNTKRNKTVQ